MRVNALGAFRLADEVWASHHRLQRFIKPRKSI
jgi:hypothetical protein